MAKRQNFQFGSTTSNIKTMTVSELNNGWEQLSILYSDVLNGTFGAISQYSYDSSQEIANAILALTGSQPTGTTTTELAGALQQMREDIETSSLTFRGYVATSAPSSSTYGLVEGNIWINANAMPTTFPVSASAIRVWNGTAWATTTTTYTAKDFDFFRNVNDGEGYYWFGGQWTVMSTDMSSDYFSLNQTTGKWEIKSSINLPGSPTTTTAGQGDNSTKIATTAWVQQALSEYVTSTTNQTISGNKTFTGTTTAVTPATTDNSTKIATTAFVKNYTIGLPNWSTQQPIALASPSVTFTASSRGYIFGSLFTIADTFSVIVSINGIDCVWNRDNHYGGSAQFFIPVETGDVCVIQNLADWSSTHSIAYFVACKNL